MTTRSLLRGITQQVERNEATLRQLRIVEGMAEDEALGQILYRSTEALPVVRSRSLENPVSVEVLDVSFVLSTDATQRIRDPNNTVGLVLTGKWIQDYARMIRLMPEYERTLAGYREQAELHRQLMAEYQGALEVKDQKVVILNEVITAHQQRGDLYKQLAEIQQDSWFETFLRKIAFPAGVTVGILAGAIIAN